MLDSVLLRNAIRTPDGTILESESRHDYKEYTDANGEVYMIDGGLSYVRSSINETPAENLAVYDTDPIESVRENLLWGTYGKDQDKPLHHVALKDMDTEHIEAVIEILKSSSSHIDQARLNVMIQELELRNK